MYYLIWIYSKAFFFFLEPIKFLYQNTRVCFARRKENKKEKVLYHLGEENGERGRDHLSYVVRYKIPNNYLSSLGRD